MTSRDLVPMAGITAGLASAGKFARDWCRERQPGPTGRSSSAASPAKRNGPSAGLCTEAVLLEVMPAAGRHDLCLGLQAAGRH
jgi:hypothetical protein